MLTRFLTALWLAVAFSPVASTVDPHAAHGAMQTLPHDIPDLCATPTTTSVTNGDWSSSGTWDNGVPTTGDVVSIAAGDTVTYDANATDVIFCVGIDGTLIFERASTLKLTVGTIYVYPSGTLDMGTTGSPVTGVVDVIFDGSINTDDDPEQYSVGLLVFGTMTAHGESKTSFVRLADVVDDADTGLTAASAPTNWDVGDNVVVPESKARTSSNQHANFGTLETERRTLSAVSGTALTVSSGFTYDHPAALNYDGSIYAYPHVANVSRNVRLSSANPSGTRGHAMFTHDADVDIRYVLFADMGRTTNANLNCTLRTTGAWTTYHSCNVGTGAITQIGTNHIGRYAVHFHHLWGPTNAENTGYQYAFIGNAVVDSTKWPVAVHNSSYGLLQGNVILGGDGAGIMLEEGTEWYNVFDGNFITGILSAGDPREQGAREGSGIWSMGFGNYFRNNVAAGIGNTYVQIVSSVGFKFFCRAAASIGTGCAEGDYPVVAKRPNFRGADMTDTDEYTQIDPQEQHILEFVDNEAYGVMTGLTIWHLANDGSASSVELGITETLIDGFSAWHVSGGGFFGYPTSNVRFDGFAVRCDKAQSRVGTYGFSYGDYWQQDGTLENFSIHGCEIGLDIGSDAEGDILIEDGIINAEVAIRIAEPATPGTTHTPAYPLSSIVRRVVTNGTGLTSGRYQNGGSLEVIDGVNHVPFFMVTGLTETQVHEDQLVETRVESYQGGAASFDLYFVEQGTADIYGEQAPCNDTTIYPEIYGVVCNVTSSGSTIRLPFRIGGGWLLDLWPIGAAALGLGLLTRRAGSVG